MAPVYLCIALGPICIYFLIVGLIHLSKYPFVTSGSRDTFALILAMTGLAVVGPMELFMPNSSAAIFRGWIWIPLIILYLLIATLVAMAVRPRIVIYNISIDLLKPVLQQTAEQVDSTAEWAGDSLVLPKLGVQLFMQATPGARNVQLVAGGGEQRINGWKQLELSLKAALRKLDVGMNPRGVTLLISSLFIVGIMTYSLINGREMISQHVRDFLRL